MFNLMDKATEFMTAAVATLSREFKFAIDAVSALSVILFELLLLYFSLEFNPCSVLSTHLRFGTLAIICAQSHCTVEHYANFAQEPEVWHPQSPLAGLTNEGRHRSGFWVV